MSSSNAAAIRRRAGIQPSTPAPAPTPTSSRSTASNSTADQSQARKLTLPEVISNFDQRIGKLEENIKSSTQMPSNASNSIQPDDLQNLLSEYNDRFEMIASEISNIKDALLSLQTYTMDVNKMLVNERVRVLSDLGNNVKMSPIEDTDITSVFSLASDGNQPYENAPGSPTSLDMREEITR
jgi:hypothetical protein